MRFRGVRLTFRRRFDYRSHGFVLPRCPSNQRTTIESHSEFSTPNICSVQHHCRNRRSLFLSSGWTVLNHEPGRLTVTSNGRHEGKQMARIEGVDPRHTSFPMRQVFNRVRKMLGRDLTPQKITARVPRVFWFDVLGEWLLGQKAAVPDRQQMLLTLRTAVRVGCPF